MKVLFRRQHEPLEPPWHVAIKEPEELKSIITHWRVIRDGLNRAGALAPHRDHSMTRLCLAYLVFDRVVPELISDGAIDSRGELNSQWLVAQQASAMATKLEIELGLAPRRR